jgi:hypothetical protein
MSHSFYRGAAVLGLALTLLLPEAQAVQPYQADYQFSIGSKFNGSASRVLSQAANGQWTYQFRARIPVVATANETSWFSLEGHQVQSQRHQMDYRILGFSKSSEIQFQGGQAQVRRNGKTSQYSTHAGTLDTLNLELQLREDLKSGGLRDRYWLSDDKSEDPVRFVLRGNATIRTPAGSFDTVRVDRIHDDPARSTSFWMAPKLDYLPVRVTQKDDSMTYDILLRAYHPR